MLMESSVTQHCIIDDHSRHRVHKFSSCFILQAEQELLHMMQAQHTQALQKQLDQLSAEVAAQRLALAAATNERDGARAAAVETSERLGVSLIWQPRSYVAVLACSIPQRASRTSSEALRLLLLWSADIFSSSLYVLLSQSPVPVPTQMVYRHAKQQACLTES